MALDRLAIRSALRKRFEADLGGLVKSFSYLEEGGAAITTASYPRLVLVIGPETVEAPERNRPPLWRLRFIVYVYSTESPNQKDPDVTHNKICAALEAALECHPDEDDSGWWTTLGDTVSRAYPVGPIDYESVEINSQHKLIFPIEVIAVPQAGRP